MNFNWFWVFKMYWFFFQCPIMNKVWVLFQFLDANLKNLIKSSLLAIVPSSFMISQMTPASSKPASLARSHAASVCPARLKTPPSNERTENVPRLNYISWFSIFCCSLNSSRAIFSRNSCSYSFCRFNGNSKSRSCLALLLLVSLANLVDHTFGEIKVNRPSLWLCWS